MAQPVTPLCSLIQLHSVQRDPAPSPAALPLLWRCSTAVFKQSLGKRETATNLDHVAPLPSWPPYIKCNNFNKWGEEHPNPKCQQLVHSQQACDEVSALIKAVWPSARCRYVEADATGKDTKPLTPGSSATKASHTRILRILPHQQIQAASDCLKQCAWGGR